MFSLPSILLWWWSLRSGGVQRGFVAALLSSHVNPQTRLSDGRRPQTTGETRCSCGPREGPVARTSGSLAVVVDCLPVLGSSWSLGSFCLVPGKEGLKPANSREVLWL